MPAVRWLDSGVTQAARQALAGQRVRDLELFDTSYSEQLIEEHESGQIDHAERLWALVVLGRWLERAPEFRWTPAPPARSG